MLTTPPMGRLPRKWSIAEDEKLREEVEAQLSEGEVKDWCRIAERLPGRTNKDCRKRWHNSVAGGLKKGQWSKNEDLQLARGVERFGQRWTLVSNTVQSRSADQCAKRWQQSLDPDLDRSEWRDSEDKVLIEAVQKLGRHWKDIQAKHFPGRSKNSIKNRYTVLLRRYQNQGIVLPFSAVTPEPTTPDIRRSTYSATDDDDDLNDDFHDSFLPSQPVTQVSTPEIQQSWGYDDESLASWSTGDSFGIVPQLCSNFTPAQDQQQYLAHISTNTNPNINVCSAPDWNYTATSMAYPQMPHQQPLPDSNSFPHSLTLLNLVPHSSYSPNTILGPTTPALMGAGQCRSFPGSPAAAPHGSSSRPSSMVCENPEAMAQMMWNTQYRMEDSQSYQYQ